MAYKELPLENYKTVITAEILNYFQTGIKNAHRISVNAVLTATEMDKIIKNATEDNIGVSYMYLGETTKSYKKGAVYTVEEV